ncbi:MAG TPA: transketolase C-terminal domain-containing protein [Terriglobales bacterium]|nr:transketolase C-terminal domain-containing protein [Terriglobales bacterium]
MRDAFAAELELLAAADPRVVLLSGDIGNRMFDRYKQRFADRFLNCGVAEANMIGVAAGLALGGLRPVVYTIAAFATLRCLEQIRVDVCYHRQPVIIAGVGAGLSYASLGGTHHACEDIAAMRMLPEMNVLCPGDPLEVRAALRCALASDQPTYLRLGKKGEPVVHSAAPAFGLGRAIALQPGRDVALLAVGTLLPNAIAAAEQLQRASLSVALASFPSIKPLDEDYLAEVFATCRVVATIEEHSVVGGAGSAVAEWLARHPGQRARLLTIGTPDRFLHQAGSQEHARRHTGLNAEAIAADVLAAYRARA